MSAKILEQLSRKLKEG
jgi:hypothetical protein